MPTAMLKIERAQCTRTNGIENVWLVTEASDIGVKPGEWPGSIVVADGQGDGTMYRFHAEFGAEVGAGPDGVDYIDSDGLKLRVFND